MNEGKEWISFDILYDLEIILCEPNLSKQNGEEWKARPCQTSSYRFAELNSCIINALN